MIHNIGWCWGGTGITLYKLGAETWPQGRVAANTGVAGKKKKPPDLEMILPLIKILLLRLETVRSWKLRE
jgi:hypothetical protein